MFPRELVNAASWMPAAQGILIIGAHGIGKSDIARQLAKGLNIPLIDVRASTMQEGDAVGYPDLDAIKENGCAVMAPPSWFKRACNEPVVLFLDEINRGLPGVQNGFMQLVLDRQLSHDANGDSLSLHPQTRVIAAMNHGVAYSGINTMDRALLSRFWVATLEVDIQQWLDHAAACDIDEVIRGFIQLHPQYLQEPVGKSFDDTDVTPDPRSWFAFNRAVRANGLSLKSLAGSSSPEIMTRLAGFVGPEAALRFDGYIKSLNRRVEVDDLFKAYNGDKKMSSAVAAFKADEIMEMISRIHEMVDAVNSDKSTTWSKDRINGVAWWFTQIPGEYQMSLHQGIMARCNADQTNRLHGVFMPFHEWKDKSGAQPIKTRIVELARKMAEKK